MSEYKPQISDLNRGVVKCQHCAKEISLTFCNPLEVVPCPDCNTPFFMPLKIKDYWLYCPLGGGGMGSVYKAISETESGEFAIKLLPRNKKNNQSLINTLLKEGEIGQILGKSPYIIEVTDYGCENGEYFMASRFVEGTRLDIFVSSAGKLSERQALDIILPLTEAEIHIKNCGYLFRDMKPENVMIEDTGTVKLFDFGLCIPIEQAANPNPEDQLEGSPFYLPPERIVAAPEGEYSEIYSLGMLLFYMLAGTTYFSHADVKDLVTKHVRSIRVASAASRLKNCSPDIVAVVDKMIKRDPNERFHTLAELKDQLIPLVKKAPGYPLATKKRKPDHIRTNTERKRKMLLPLTFFIVTITAVSAFLGWQHYQKQQHKKLLQEITKKAAEELNITPDVKPPALNLQKLKKLINAETKKRLNAKKLEFPQFNREEALNNICKVLNVTPSSLKKPEISPDELKKLAKQELNRRIEKALKKSSPKFDKNKVKKQLAKTLHITFPVKKPSKTLSEIRKEALKKANQLADKKYPSKAISPAISKILQKYKCYKIGEKVTVPTNTRGNITGIYQGRSGRMIIIEGKEIMLKDLPPEIALKFNEPLSAKLASDAIKQIRTEFKSKKMKYREEIYRSTFANICRNSGYRQDSKGNWIPAQDYLNKLVKQKQKDFEKKKLAKEEAIITSVKKEFDEKEFYRKYGYTLKNNRISSIYDNVQYQLNKKKNQLYVETKKKLKELEPSIRNEVEIELYEANGYIFRNGKWQSAKALLDASVQKKLSRAKQ